MGRCSKKCMWVGLSILALLFIATTPLAHAQFDVSPPEFTTSPIPPSGSNLKLAQELSIRNRDNTKRLFSVYAVTPPEDMVGEGFEPIPDNSWLFIVDGFVEIDAYENKSVEMWVNIPRWDNLLDKRWEAWIRVERIAEPGEVISQSVDVVARLVTATEPAPPPTTSFELPLEVIILVAVVVTVVALLGAWAWSRRRTSESGVTLE